MLKLFWRWFGQDGRPVVVEMSEEEFWRSERGLALIAGNERRLRDELDAHARRGPASDDLYAQLRFDVERLRIVARYRQIVEGRERIRWPVRILS